MDQVTELADCEVTLRKPISTKDVVGVNEITDDWSLDDGDGGAEEDEEHVKEVDTDVVDNSQTEVQGNESLSELMAVNNSGKHVPYFVVENGSKIYKTT